MENNKATRGVKPGTKRAPYGKRTEETITINFRVPKSIKNDAKAFIRPLLKQFIAFHPLQPRK